MTDEARAMMSDTQRARVAHAETWPVDDTDTDTVRAAAVTASTLARLAYLRSDAYLYAGASRVRLSVSTVTAERAQRMSDAHSVRMAALREMPEHLRRYVLETPALTGAMVCQGHADVCALIGHSVATRVELDGARYVSPYCARCGVERVDSPKPVAHERDTCTDPRCAPCHAADMRAWLKADDGA